MRYLILSFFFAGVVSTLTAAAQSVLPEDLRCMPVLIQIPLPDGRTATGTGIYLMDSNRLFLVTAAHVIFDEGGKPGTLINSNAMLASCVRGSNLNDRAVLALDLRLLQDKGLLKRHPRRDIVVALVGTLTQTTNGYHRSGSLSGGVSALSNKLVVPWDASEACKTYSQLPDGNEIYVLGYPASLVIKDRYEDIDFNEPLVRKGILSQKNRKTGRLVIDSAVYHGNSGGPALIAEHPSLDMTTFQLVGIVIKYVPVVTDIEPVIGVTNRAFANSGYSVVEPIDYALELIHQ